MSKQGKENGKRKGSRWQPEIDSYTHTLENNFLRFGLITKKLTMLWHKLQPRRLSASLQVFLLPSFTLVQLSVAYFLQFLVLLYDTFACYVLHCTANPKPSAHTAFPKLLRCWVMLSKNSVLEWAGQNQPASLQVSNINQQSPTGGVKRRTLLLWCIM